MATAGNLESWSEFKELCISDDERPASEEEAENMLEPTSEVLADSLSKLWEFELYPNGRDVDLSVKLKLKKDALTLTAYFKEPNGHFLLRELKSVDDSDFDTENYHGRYMASLERFLNLAIKRDILKENTDVETAYSQFAEMEEEGLNAFLIHLMGKVLESLQGDEPYLWQVIFPTTPSSNEELKTWASAEDLTLSDSLNIYPDYVNKIATRVPEKFRLNILQNERCDKTAIFNRILAIIPKDVLFGTSN